MRYGERPARSICLDLIFLYLLFAESVQESLGFFGNHHGEKIPPNRFFKGPGKMHVMCCEASFGL